MVKFIIIFLFFSPFLASRLAGLADSFYDEIKSLPMEEDGSKDMLESHVGSTGTKRFKKRKVIHN